MAEETTTAEPEATTAAPEATEEEQRVPYERFQQANKKAKEAADRAKTLEKQMSDLQAQMDERESAGLPELERERKRAEALEKRIADAEARAEQAEQRVQNSQRERWITAAARDFNDPSDAVAFASLEDIETEADAERAVKRIAKAKPHLLRQEDHKLPGKVLENGQRVAPAAPGSVDKIGDADRQWAEEVAPMLKRMVSGYQSTSS